MAERIEVLLTEKEVDDRIQAIGEQTGASRMRVKGRKLFYV